MSSGIRSAVGDLLRVRLRDRMRSPGARTRTRHQKKKDDVVQQAEGLVTKDCGIVKLYKRVPKHAKTLGRYDYQNQTNWIVQGSQGIQVVDYLELFFNRDQMLGTTSSDRQNRTRYADDLYTLNPFYAHPASAIYAANANVSRNDVLYIKGVDVTLNLLSMVPYPQIVKVYWMMPKLDSTQGPIDHWNSILESKRMGQGVQTLASTLTQPTAGAGKAEANDVGANPFHHREFAAHWKALKVNHLVLQAGEQINLNIKFAYEKIVNRESVTLRSFHMRGLTIVPMIIAHAGLVGISADEASKATEVSHGAVKIGTVLNQKMRFEALPQSRFSTARMFDGTLINAVGVVKTIDDNDLVQPITTSTL